MGIELYIGGIKVAIAEDFMEINPDCRLGDDLDLQFQSYKLNDFELKMKILNYDWRMMRKLKKLPRKTKKALWGTRRSRKRRLKFFNPQAIRDIEKLYKGVTQ